LEQAELAFAQGEVEHLPAVLLVRLEQRRDLQFVLEAKLAHGADVGACVEDRAGGGDGEQAEPDEGEPPE
jgi:hypothetical protein